MESPTSVPAPLRLSTSSPSGSPGLSPSASPNRSRASSRASHLTLDLSCVTPILPTPPTNTLLITGINDVEVFSPPNISQLRDVIQRTAPLASWSPLKSFRRIVCSFTTVDDAVAVRGALDGEALLSSRLRIYFGEHTPLQPDGDRHLHAPESKKLFFISPPPSPPHGWESKSEDPPNSVVVAEDLAHALAHLTWESRPQDPAAAPDPATSSTTNSNSNSNSAANSASATTATADSTTTGGLSNGRSRSGSFLLFEPEDASKEDMPAISVDDYTDESGDERSPPSPLPLPASAHTSRPPVELAHDA
jgi:hypothetical protein